MQSLPLSPLLVGESLELRPLEAVDFAALYGVACDPLIWAQHQSSTRYQEPVFRQWFDDALAARSTLIVIDRDSGKVAGSFRYYEFNEDQREVAIGYTFLAREKWGGSANKELKYLMLGHAFQWVDTVWFHVAGSNIRSQRAMEKIGGQLSHTVLKQVNGGTQENLFFKVRRTAFESQLSLARS